MIFSPVLPSVQSFLLCLPVLLAITAFAFDTNNETFCYNDFTNMDEEQFAEFMAECEKRMAYDTGIRAEFGDEILTLSTCEYTHENGRFVVVSKKVANERITEENRKAN